MQPDSLAAWLTLLETRHPVAIDMGLERVGQVADRLGVRTPGCPVITVGGTNGKGSTVATLVSIYHAADRHVGSYTSPHLLHFNERICIDGAPVSDATLVAAFAQVEAARGDISLTYFEFTTLAALVIFGAAALDVVVLEVGLGGRLDAVNVVDADVAVVTNIVDPDVIVLGGGLSNVERLYRDLPPLVERYAFTLGAPPRIVKNMHGDSSGVRGAAWLWPESQT